MSTGDVAFLADFSVSCVVRSGLRAEGITVTAGIGFSRRKKKRPFPGVGLEMRSPGGGHKELYGMSAVLSMRRDGSGGNCFCWGILV